jgi:hypothetical protein
VLSNVSADSPTDAWAAGTPNTGGGFALLLHWNGTSWSRVPLPAAAAGTSGVSALSPTDAWAVGDRPGHPAANTLVLHWNGTNWVRVPSPSPHPGQGSSLVSVSALTPDDALAVGDGPGNGPVSIKDIALSWNGTSWARVPIPSPNNQSGMEGVSADSPSDAWAVGNSFVGRGEQSFIVHWNGSKWALVPSPNPGKKLTHLSAVSAVSSDDAWAVGYYFVGTRQKTLILHWKGTSWAQVPSPSPGTGPGGSVLSGVSALSVTDAWAVGASPSGTFVLHWDGTSWVRVHSPSPGGSLSLLQAVSADSPSDVWAVGYESSGGKGPAHTVILHWNGTNWQRS